MSVFVSTQKILFQHCDPARIVFYPRYFEIVNAVVEQWYEEAVGVSFAQMHMVREEGVPTLKTEAYFPAPSRLGETLQFSLRVARMETSSVDLDISAECEGEVRVEVKLTLVHISNTTGKSKPWPADMRGPMMNYICE